MNRVLFISGSLGLGHIQRDLVIAGELRKLVPDVEIQWIAADPATKMIQEAGEKLHPKYDLYANDTAAAERASSGSQLNLLKYLNNASKEWETNVTLVDQITRDENFDVIVGDETYEIAVGFSKRPEMKRAPFVMIYDFVGMDSMSANPLEWLGVYIWNRLWSEDLRKGTEPSFDEGIFIGEEEDVEDRPFGFLLPGRREWAKSRCKFVGYILPFDPRDYRSDTGVSGGQDEKREPLIVCAIGGTAIGKELLILCGDAFGFIKERAPAARMVLVCGPRLKKEGLAVPAGVEVREYVPNLFELFAKCDVAIVQGGGTTTLELTALQKPFVYFPLERHFEQAQVARRLERHRAGVRRSYSETPPEELAEDVLRLLDAQTNYAEIPLQGGARAAELIAAQMQGTKR